MSPIAIGVAGSDLSTLIVELNHYDPERFGPLWPGASRMPVYQLEMFAIDEGATDQHKCQPEGVLFVRGMHEAIRRFSEVTGGTFVEPSAFKESA